MIRVTPDTNVLVSGLFYNGNERAVLHTAINGEIRLILSLEIIDELIRVLEKKFKLPSEMTRDYILRLNEISDIITPRKLPSTMVRDREDAKIIECAHSGHSDYIVSGDRDLLSLEQYHQTKIVSPNRLLRTLKQKRPTA